MASGEQAVRQGGEVRVPLQFHEFFGCGQIKADPSKVQVVVEWPIPTTTKQLQQFLGFANFYRRLQQGSSTANQINFKVSFSSLKTLLTSAPILIHPDPNMQFIMEVDASDSGVGAVLSQHLDPDQKRHHFLC